MFKRSFATFVLVSLLALTGLGCSSTPAVPASKAQPITLEYWGVFTDTDDMQILIDAFQRNHPNIQVNYRKFRPEEYKQKLIEAFAEDRGPDLFTIQNSWLPEYQSKLAPQPKSLSYAVFTSSGSGINQTTTVSLATKAGLTLKDIRDKFVGVVESDAMALASSTSTEKSLYALPFYVDTLAMYYNKDLMAENQITAPPADWNEILLEAEKLTKPTAPEDKAKGLTLSVVAMGTGQNVHRATDIISELMMQNGATMSRDDGRVTFHLPAANQAQNEGTPAARALQFYTDFANPEKQAYTWNAAAGDSLDAFVQGRLMYYFGYSYDYSTIKSRNPRLNFAVAEIPRFGKQVNIANYWMEAVSKKSKFKDEAWLFIIESATHKDALTKYLNSTKRASALNEIIKDQLGDIQLATFAKQNLTARSWYRGKDSAAAETIVSEMLDDTLKQVLNPPESSTNDDIFQNAVNRAAARLNDTL